MPADRAHRFAPDLPEPPIEVLAHLRAATREPHERLEAALDLLAPPLERARFARVLVRFHGLHAAWEPAMSARAGLAEMISARTRLPHLRADLLALGSSPGEIDALPACRPAAALADTEAGAWGSLYVMEGSTLGGKMIARALAGAPWLPPAGLTYFDARGADTGRLWRALGQALDAAAPTAAQREALAHGAAEAFDVVRAWVASTSG